MKRQTSELEGALLDAAVAMCEGLEFGMICLGHLGKQCIAKQGEAFARWSPSIVWDQGGPLIERDRIGLYPPETTQGPWLADLEWHELTPSNGPTPLIAAMRAYVASKLGDEVEIPE